MTKKPNANRAEFNQRVEAVLKIRLDGAQFHDLKQYATEQGWDVSDRQLFRYARAADALILKHAEENREVLIARHVSQRRSLYARAINAGDFSTALRILDSECTLLGLFPDSKKTPPTDAPSVWGPALAGMNDEELAVLARVADRAGKLTLTRTTTTAELTLSESQNEAEPAAPAGSDPEGSLPPPLPRVCFPDDDSV